MYAVILAGGGGTRLWPLSRPARPKPFLPLLGETSLLQRTVARIAPLVPADRVYVVTDRRYAGLVAEQLPDVPAANVLGEPMGRNTAAAVALAAEAIDRGGDEVMLVLPADAYIRDEAGFCDALGVAERLAGDGSLVTLGVTPTGPETGYGYVVAAPPAREIAGRSTFAVERFVEKPTAQRAAELIATGLASWNAGIFVWTRSSIRDRLARHAPEIVGPIHDALAADGGAIAGRTEVAYPSVRSTAIDYAVLEPASLEGAVAVVPVSVGWTDLGSWAALRDAWADATAGGAGGGVSGTGNRHDVGSSETLVLAADRLVVTIGLRDVVIVDTPDALLVCAAERSQDVRQVAEQFPLDGGVAKPAAAASAPGAVAARTEEPGGAEERS